MISVGMNMQTSSDPNKQNDLLETTRLICYEQVNSILSPMLFWLAPVEYVFGQQQTIGCDVINDPENQLHGDVWEYLMKEGDGLVGNKLIPFSHQCCFCLLLWIMCVISSKQMAVM